MLDTPIEPIKNLKELNLTLILRNFETFALLNETYILIN